MRSDLQNLYVKVFVLFAVIIIYINPLHTIAEVKVFSHEEKKDYGPEAIPHVLRINTYDDGTAVVRIVRTNQDKTTSIMHCNHEIFFLRFIYPNGTVIEKDINLEGVQNFNYCAIKNGFNDLLEFDLIRDNQIMIRYFNATNSKKVSTYEGWGMIIDFEGKVYDRTFMGYRGIRADYDKIQTTLLKLIFNINKEKGFIICYYQPESTNVNWQQFKIESDGIITKLTNGTIELKTDINYINDETYYSMIPTVDEGYSFVYKVITGDLSRGQLYAAFISYNEKGSANFILYQSNLADLEPEPISCNVEYVGVGHSCSIIGRPVTNITTANITHNMISFLSSGSIISFNTTKLLPPVNSGLTSSWLFESLLFGGYLLTKRVEANNGIFICLYSESGDVTCPSELENPVKTNKNYAYVILPNNTLLIAQMESNNTWNLNSIDLPKLTTSDKGYFNTNINSTYPEINSLIHSDITTISIDFYNPVTLSTDVDGKLSIYQKIGETPILRQKTFATQCELDNDDKRVIVNILNSTFSKSGGDYYVKIDNNFVKDRNYREPLLGIKDNVWRFTIINEKPSYIITGPTSGLLRLTAEGTEYFQNLSSDEQNQFFVKLLDGLADSVLISRNRLSKYNKNQLDPDSNNNQKKLLISIRIEGNKNQYEKDVTSVINDINYMMSNYNQTPIGYDQLTYLDSDYRFNPVPDYWKEYKFKLLSVFLAVIVLILLYFLARKREKKGNNFVIFKFVLFTFDFVTDFLFLTNNANDVPKLFIPSIIFFVIPIGFNTVLAFLTITEENKRPEFSRWFTENSKFASTFTILAGADVEVLSTLESNLAGFKVFQAPFSDSARAKIFWGSFSNIFIEDFPQLIIQILYRISVITYDVIPILSLTSSSITLTINIVGRLYQAIIYIRNRNLHPQPIIGRDNELEKDIK
ncbi:hypothetical protein RclHR1_01560008 [Rhizophagus clarus]|uniref:Uncharacterized protein n=1 Tax=Rhizophagus clarus TaxID=94130 RepID=A0A2Z6QJS5_9GLOM|nr:hypothetical protein RclHR1_01560008 [Rhizophagus clarus]GES72896.1 hypothetical protein GLOIN_2v1629918 [Rhizophagus clarus]